MFPETKSRETLRFEGNKIHCSPRDQSLSDLLYSKTKAKFENLAEIPAITCNSGQHLAEQIFRLIGVLNRFTELRHSKVKYKFIFYKESYSPSSLRGPRRTFSSGRAKEECVKEIFWGGGAGGGVGMLVDFFFNLSKVTQNAIIY